MHPSTFNSAPRSTMSTPEPDQSEQTWVTPSFDHLPVPREPFAQANARVNADPEFNAQLKALLKHFDGISETRLRQQAGGVKGFSKAENPNGDMNETAMDCLRACCPPHLIPEDLEHKIARVVNSGAPKRDAADFAFKQRWAEYLEACKARKQRIADAVQNHAQRRAAMLAAHKAERDEMAARHEQELSELQQELADAKNEPAPAAPQRDA